MNTFARRDLSRVWLWLLVVLMIVAVLFVLQVKQEESDPDAGTQAKRTSGQVLDGVVRASAFQPAIVAAASSSGFVAQTRLGFTAGNQWEPAIAADHFGHIYLLYPQYSGVPGCAACASPTMILQISSDRGSTWTSPQIMYPAGDTTGQWDAQIVVDPIDGRTVYAAWLQNGKSDIVVAKSVDFGLSWSVVTADHTNAGTDKPILAVRGQDVYVGYNHSQKVWVSSSHNGGATFVATNVNSNAKLGWSLAGGGTIDPNGNVYFSWAGYEQNGGAKGPVNLYISKSIDRGNTWTNIQIDRSGAPPDCSAALCGWAYLGAQVTMASDANGVLYAMWNAGPVNKDKSPERIYFAKSTDGGTHWLDKVDVSTAPQGVNHAFPAIAARGAGDVRISWMDARASGGTLWNVYYRSSTNGGATWTSATDLSTAVAGYSYIFPEGFSYPFGDYYEMDIDDRGDTHLVWGEGLNYSNPGSIWYTRGK